MVLLKKKVVKIKDKCEGCMFAEVDGMYVNCLSNNDCEFQEGE